MSSHKITLYAPRGPFPNQEPLSPFSRLIVYALGYRGIEYTYHPVPLSEVQPFAPTINAKPTTTWPDGTQKYTFPAIVDATNPSAPVTIADSLEILKYIEKTYPDPAKPLFANPSAPALELLAAGSIPAMAFPMFNGILMRGALKHISDADKEHLKTSLLGGQDPNSLLIPVGSEEYVSLVNKAKEEFTKMAGILAGQSGMWLAGEKPAYADFVLLASLNILRRMDGDLWEQEFSKIDGGRFAKIYEAGEKQYSKFY